MLDRIKEIFYNIYVFKAMKNLLLVLIIVSVV